MYYKHFNILWNYDVLTDLLLTWLPSRLVFRSLKDISTANLYLLTVLGRLWMGSTDQLMQLL